MARDDLAGRQLDIAAAHRRLDIGDGQIAGGKRAAVEPDADGVAPLTANIDAGHALERRQPVDEEAVDIIGDPGRRHAFGCHGKPHHRVGVAIVLDDARLVGAFRQARPDAADSVAHIVGGFVDIAADFEHDDGAAAIAPAVGRDRLDAGNAGDGALDDLGYVGIDDVGGGTDIGRGHRDDGGIDIRQFAHRNRQQSRDAHDDDHQARHQRQHRTADREIGQCHDADARSARLLAERVPSLGDRKQGRRPFTGAVPEEDEPFGSNASSSRRPLQTQALGLWRFGSAYRGAVAHAHASGYHFVAFRDAGGDLDMAE